MEDLYNYTVDEAEWDDSYEKISDLTKNGEWNLEILGGMFTTEMVEHIAQNMKPSYQEREYDTPYWIVGTKEVFIIKSDWQSISDIGKTQIRCINGCGLKGPFRIIFFMWGLTKIKIRVNDRLRRLGIESPSQYWCCANLDHETLAHVFLRSFIANRKWTYFNSFIGIHIEGLNLGEVIMLWWGA